MKITAFSGTPARVAERIKETFGSVEHGNMEITMASPHVAYGGQTGGSGSSEILVIVTYEK